jgi:hypothetical protein
MSRQALARAAGLDVATVYCIEEGITPFQQYHVFICRAAAACGIQNIQLMRLMITKLPRRYRARAAHVAAEYGLAQLH